MSASLVNNKFRITRRIGGGSFGEIYLGIGPSGEKVAVKFERHGTKCPQLRHEYKVYREMQNCHGFCNVYYFGVQDNYNVMVMDLLGPSLEDLFNKCGRKFSLKTVLQIADQMLERVDTLHSRHLIHRDIKPANFVVGIGEQGSTVFCVDFGLSKRYRHPKTLQHIPHRDGRSLTGTPRYASINNHLGVEQARRDDLESIGYVLVYFIKGTLPWQGLKAKNPQKKYRMILEKKQQVSIAQLCQGLPSQFAEFLAYTRSLKFDAKPDIPYLRKLFRDLYHAQGCASIPKLWDWDPIDADYLTSNNQAQSGGPPVEGATAQGGGPSNNGYGGGERPNTTMAVGHPADTTEVGTGIRTKLERPTTAQSRGQTTNSWGYNQSGTQPGYAQQGGNGNYQTTQQTSGQRPSSAVIGGGIAGETAADPSRRPHTAGNRAADGDGNQEGGDAVVAGARAMMRYRRTRASTTEAAAGIGSNIGKSWVGGDANGGTAQGHAGYVGGQQQQSGGFANNMSRMFYAGGAKAQGPTQGQQQGGGSWLGGGGTDRPKSAGLFGSSGAAPNRSGQPSNGGAPPLQGRYGGGSGSGAPSAANTSYGAIKNRFMPSGQAGNQAPQANVGKSKSSSKLFSLGSR